MSEVVAVDITAAPAEEMGLTPRSGGTSRSDAKLVFLDFDPEAVDPKAHPPSRATREAWDAFDEGWSRFSNPYPAGTPEHEEWAWGWHEAEGHHQAMKDIDAGADPEDYK